MMELIPSDSFPKRAARRSLLMFAAFSIGVFTSLSSFAATSGLEGNKLRYRDYVLAQSSREVSQEVPEAPPSRPFNIPDWLHLKFNSVIGYDTNPRFATPKKSDGFFEEFFAVTVDLPLRKVPLAFFEKDRLSFTYQLDNYNYFKHSEVNLFDQVLSWDWRHPIAGPLEFSAVYSMDLYRFPDDNQVTFMSNAVDLGLTWKSRYVHHGPHFIYLNRDFDKRKALEDDGLPGSHDRNDDLYVGQYRFVVSFWNKVFLQHTQEMFLQRSNDNFQHFNEYGGYRTTSALTTERIYGLQPILRLGYERRDYRERRVPGGDKKETDDYFFIGFSAFYALSPYADLGFNYLCRQNKSNDPVQDYFSNQLTWGLYLNI